MNQNQLRGDTEPRSVDQQQACSAGSFPKRQDALDWQVFAAAFSKRNGFTPHPMDTGHKEYFHWFTVGAHEEFMGRLTVKPKTRAHRLHERADCFRLHDGRARAHGVRVHRVCS